MEKVAVVKCSGYENDKVSSSIERIFDILQLQRNQDKVLIKPNMLSARKPEEGVTTHPVILEEIIKRVKGKEILIGDSPASANKEIEKYWDECGFRKVSEETGAKLVKFSKSKFVKIKGVEIPLWDQIEDYKIFNIAKFKTHTLTTLTLSVKNLYGLIPGYTKSLLHSKFISPYDFSSFLVEFYKKIEKYVYFNLVDGIVSMEGNGPSNGTLRKTDVLIAGRNAIAVDIICCKIAGVELENIPYLEIYKRKYGLPEIEIVGDKVDKIKNFKLPSTTTSKILSNPLLKPFLKILSKNFSIQPEINKEKCKRCLSCYYVCPVKAISKNLKIDRKKCIGCLCCYEVCSYKAIDLKKSLIAKVFT